MKSKSFICCLAWCGAAIIVVGRDAGASSHTQGAAAVYVDVGSSGLRARVFLLDNPLGRRLAERQALGSLAGKVVASKASAKALGLPTSLYDYIERPYDDLTTYVALFASALKDRLCPVCYPEAIEWCTQPLHHGDQHLPATDPTFVSPCIGSRVRVYATAGLRLLHKKHGHGTVIRFWEVLHHALSFALPQELVVEEQVIDGTSEAFYAWVEANLLLGTQNATNPLLPEPAETAVVMEMGGSSFQATLPLVDEEDARMFHIAAANQTKALNKLNFVRSGMDLRSGMLPSLKGTMHLYEAAAFSFLSIVQGRSAIKCCKQGDSNPPYWCMAAGTQFRSPEECLDIKRGRHVIGGRIGILSHLLHNTAENSEHCSAAAAEEDFSVKVPTASFCLTSAITLNGQVCARSVAANGSACDVGASTLVWKDVEVHTHGDFFRWYMAKHRHRRTLAIGDFAMLHSVGLQNGRRTLAQIRQWAIGIIDAGCVTDESQNSCNDFARGPLGGSNAAILLVLYHIFKSLGYDVDADLTTAHSILEPTESMPIWPRTGLNSDPWHPAADVQGTWEVSWSLGALFIQYLTLPTQ